MNILIVEDEIFVAMEMEHVVSELGHCPVGVAADRRQALRLAERADVAIVDINLRDGPTGVEIGRVLARDHGVTVVFMTANPSQLGDGVPQALGVLSKPVADVELRNAIRYAVARHRQQEDVEPPARLSLFVTQDPGGEARLAG